MQVSWQGCTETGGLKFPCCRDQKFKLTHVSIPLGC
jgi:hypothetical protein